MNRAAMFRALRKTIIASWNCVSISQAEHRAKIAKVDVVFLKEARCIRGIQDCMSATRKYSVIKDRLNDHRAVGALGRSVHRGLYETEIGPPRKARILGKCKRDSWAAQQLDSTAAVRLKERFFELHWKCKRKNHRKLSRYSKRWCLCPQWFINQTGLCLGRQGTGCREDDA